jgi:hypothetical protein
MCFRCLQGINTVLDWSRLYGELDHVGEYSVSMRAAKQPYGLQSTAMYGTCCHG